MTYTDYVVNEDVTNSISLNGSYSAVYCGDSLTMDGTLTLSGGMADTVEFDIEVDMSSSPYSFSGVVTIGGKAFDASAFLIK